eukprot:SAG31_NODE_3565_length_4119_cov_108.823383_3_plen_234_part_00
MSKLTDPATLLLNRSADVMYTAMTARSPDEFLSGWNYEESAAVREHQGLPDSGCWQQAGTIIQVALQLIPRQIPQASSLLQLADGPLDPGGSIQVRCLIETSASRTISTPDDGVSVSVGKTSPGHTYVVIEKRSLFAKVASSSERELAGLRLRIQLARLDECQGDQKVGWVSLMSTTGTPQFALLGLFGNMQTAPLPIRRNQEKTSKPRAQKSLYQLLGGSKHWSQCVNPELC